MNKADVIILARRIGSEHVFYVVCRDGLNEVLAIDLRFDKIRGVVVWLQNLSAKSLAEERRGKSSIWLAAGHFDGWFEASEAGLSNMPFNLASLIRVERLARRVLRITEPHLLFIVIDVDANVAVGIYESEGDADEHAKSGTAGAKNLLGKPLPGLIDGRMLSGVYMDTLQRRRIRLPTPPVPLDSPGI